MSTSALITALARKTGDRAAILAELDRRGYAAKTVTLTADEHADLIAAGDLS